MKDQRCATKGCLNKFAWTKNEIKRFVSKKRLSKKCCKCVDNVVDYISLNLNDTKFGPENDGDKETSSASTPVVKHGEKLPLQEPTPSTITPQKDPAENRTPLEKIQSDRKPNSAGTSNRKKKSPEKRNPIRVYCGGGKYCGFQVNYKLKNITKNDSDFLGKQDFFPAYCDGSTRKIDTPKKNSNERRNHQCEWNDILCIQCRGEIEHNDLVPTLSSWRCPKCSGTLHGGIITNHCLVLH